jgi:hypothetical protein
VSETQLSRFDNEDRVQIDFFTVPDFKICRHVIDAQVF